MHGFQPTSARRAAQHQVNGGPIRGPGTGTSDSIEKTVPEGSFIMPADSTAKLGEGELAGLGAPVPVRVSNGEYELPPEQVHAVGVKALNAMKNATHAPVGEGFGFKPRMAESSMFFADGGDVNRVGNSYSGGNVAGGVTINGGAPRGTMSVVDRFSTPAAPTPRAVVPAAASTLPMPSTTPPPAPAATSAGVGVIDSSAQRQQFFDQATAGTAAAQGFAPRSARAPSTPPPAMSGAGLGFRAPGADAPPAAGAPGVQESDGFGFQPRGFANGGAVKEEERAAFGIYPRPSAARSTAVNDAALQRGVVATGPSSFQPAGALPAASAPMRLNNLSDPRSAQFAGPAAERAPLGFSAASTAAPRPSPVEPVAESAPAPSAMPMASTGPAADEAAPTSALGFGPTAQRRNSLGSEADASAQAANLHAFNASVPAGGLSVIGNPGPAAAQAMFDAADLRTAAARGAWSPRRGFQSDQGAVAAAAIPVQNRQQAELEAGRQAADLGRASLGFQSAAQREDAAARAQSERIAAEDRRAADTNSIRREEVAGANRLRDTQVSAAQDEAALRRVVLDPKSTASDRAKAQQALLAVQGKVAPNEWAVQVTPATKNADGSSTEGSIYRVNRQTGDVQRVDAQGQAAAMPPGMTRQVGTSGGRPVYEDAQGKRFIGG